MKTTGKARVIAALRSAVVVFPELRIGQLLNNVTPPGKDLFYLSDDELADALHVYMQEQYRRP